MSRYIIGIIAGILISPVLLALAGSLNPSTGPTDARSQMYTLEQIYDRLDSGTASTKMSAFTEPSSGPGSSTMHTLDEIMGIAPAMDNTNGVTTTQVISGTTFGGLNVAASQWATQTGEMPDNGPGSTIVPTTTNQSLAAGYWSTANTVQGDADLDQWNIRSGVTIFGVTGKCNRLPATGQTTEYSSGDDGTYQYGCRPVVIPQDGNAGGNFNRTDLPWSSSGGTGFVDMGDGTVRDILTGLIWLKNANCFGEVNWASAVTNANGLAGGSCGLTDGSNAGDWRLPNLNELRSLINPDSINPSLPAGHPFTNVQSNSYWSSTTNANAINYAWNVHVSNSYVGYAALKVDPDYVWPVRGP